jgi:hypothetical protein
MIVISMAYNGLIDYHFLMGGIISREDEYYDVY